MAASTSSSTVLKPNRPAPFTPKRPVSSSAAAVHDDKVEPSKLPRSATPSSLTSAKKYKSALSSESRTRLAQPRPKSSLSTVPGSPTRKSPPEHAARPKTPGTPGRRGAESPMLFPQTSEMDVSRVDPEEVLVDYQTLEPGDVSGEVDEAWLKDYGKEDKVLVSIRIRPTSQPSAWDTAGANSRALKLHPQYAKNSANAPQEFHFDEILTGSENKPVYNAVARSHVCAAMDGYNAVIFAYGQTASGKTFTLSGDESQPGIIPRAMKDVFSYIRRTPSREYLLRTSYLEIYNEAIHDLLAPPSSSSSSSPVQIQGAGVLSPLREEVVTSLKGVKAVLERGEGNRRTASTDWNERSSRSHSVFRLVIESRERGSGSGSGGEGEGEGGSGRMTPGNGHPLPLPGGPRLQARGGRSVQTSVLSLIDLAGSERATSDKERTREGKYINTSLLTLGSVIGTLAENAAKNKSDHVPYRNSKLTRLLQPSLSGNARISVVCTINPDVGAVPESMSTLLFAQRIKRVQLNAQRKEVVDTDALIERYRKEIEDLKARLAEREAEAPVRSRRLSAREQLDESKAMRDLNSRIQQLSKLILTSQTVDETKGDESRPSSPAKVDFDMSPYQLQQELLATRRQLESQSAQILSLEAALVARPALPADAPDGEKNRLIADQARTIRELEIVVRGYEDNLGAPLRAVREDVEREWEGRVEDEKRRREEKEAWANELVRQLEKEKKARMALEEQRRALAAFVSKFDSLGLGGGGGVPASSKLRPPMPSAGGASAAFAERQQHNRSIFSGVLSTTVEESPVRLDNIKAQPSLLEQMLPEEEELLAMDDISFELEKSKGRRPASPLKEGKENLPALF
ncbi:hypothetical protein PLICRDRAFT_163991 [Plicaturopsis crispa FD-325 SS-3]|nr:hypothetical protein PLICRDRAFT_163991 [Plicaturopsis crispa FD-325 SS-3]